MKSTTQPLHAFYYYSVNQHRVVKSNQSGMLKQSVLDFETEFRRRVLGIGRVLAMMGPWDDPAYLVSCHLFAHQCSDMHQLNYGSSSLLYYRNEFGAFLNALRPSKMM